MKKILPPILFFILLFVNTENNNAMGQGNLMQKTTDTSVIQTARDAFMYCLPLVLEDLTLRQSTTVPSSRIFAPINQFKHISIFPNASYKQIVRPNADTYYSMAFLDLGAEPVVLSVPNTNGRYYMMPMMDAYTNVFASPGTRTTGNDAHIFLISGPQWKGNVPAGMQEIKSPTNTVWILGRTQVNSEADGRNVAAPLQHQYKLIPLSAFGKPYSPPAVIADTTVPKAEPNVVVKNMSVVDFFNYANQLMIKNPPPVIDNAALKRFAAIGVGAGKTFDINAIPTDDRTTVMNIPVDVLNVLSKKAAVPKKGQNGWAVMGSTMGNYGTNYIARAFIAYYALGANLPQDAIYPTCEVDADGQPFNGANNYELHFDKGETPPANAFWSLTMYTPDGHFVDNTINRYTLGDRSNLKTNTDGSVDIYIQHAQPGEDKESNWLPAPEGQFNLLIRVYWPKEEMLNGSWKMPPVKKL